jgi:hypothetical protein
MSTGREGSGEVREITLSTAKGGGREGGERGGESERREGKGRGRERRGRRGRRGRGEGEYYHEGHCRRKEKKLTGLTRNLGSNLFSGTLPFFDLPENFRSLCVSISSK